MSNKFRSMPTEVSKITIEDIEYVKQYMSEFVGHEQTEAEKQLNLANNLIGLYCVDETDFTRMIKDSDHKLPTRKDFYKLLQEEGFLYLDKLYIIDFIIPDDIIMKDGLL